MNSIKFIIPGRLPGMNEFHHECNRHRMAGAAMKKTAMEQCMWSMLECKKKKVHFDNCSVDITWYEPNKRRDPDNISAFGRKVIFDALQQMGVISNDGWKQISSITERWKVDKQNPRIEIVLTEVIKNEQGNN